MNTDEIKISVSRNCDDIWVSLSEKFNINNYTVIYYQYRNEDGILLFGARYHLQIRNCFKNLKKSMPNVFGIIKDGGSEYIYILNKEFEKRVELALFNFEFDNFYENLVKNTYTYDKKGLMNMLQIKLNELIVEEIL